MIALAVVTDCPPETGGRAKRRGWIKQFSVFTFQFVKVHPLPLRVLPPVSGGEFAGAVFTVVTNCPPETSGTSEAEGVDKNHSRSLSHTEFTEITELPVL